MPAAAVHTWLSHYIEQDGVNELNVSAKRVIALTEARLARVMQGTDDLAAPACAPVPMRTATP